MKNLLFKEFKLAMHPSVYFFLLCAALLLIPSWPYVIAFGYIFIGIMNMLIYARANQDILFTVFLPIRKRDVVRARVYAIATIELVQVIAAVPFAILRNAIYGYENQAGMNLNAAFFGFILIMYALFNIILFPMFFKNGYKPGIPMALAVIATLVFFGLVETAMHTIPVLTANLNALDAQHLVYQLPVLAAGIVLFALFTLLSSRMAEKNFEKVDL